jgi:hypothetical protein
VTEIVPFALGPRFEGSATNSLDNADFDTLVSTMTRADVEKLTMMEGEGRDITTGKPAKFGVNGLPSHLQAEITGGQSGYSFSLVRTGDIFPYKQHQRSATPEAAMEALKRLLTWEP